MTSAQAYLKKSLTDAIRVWMDENCDNDEWLEEIGYVGNLTADFMADAALAVLFGIAEFQVYAEKEGFFDKSR